MIEKDWKAGDLQFSVRHWGTTTYVLLGMSGKSQAFYQVVKLGERGIMTVTTGLRQEGFIEPSEESWP